MRDEYDFSKGRRGKVAKEVKTIKTFRLDPDVLLWLEEEGEKNGMGYQTFLNWFLRKSMESKETLEQRVQKLEKAVFKKKS